MSDEMRPNPRYLDLQSLFRLAQDQQEAVATALDHATEVMASGDAWTGPTTAAQFLHDLEQRRNALPCLAQQLVDDICDELLATPEEVPDTLQDQVRQEVPM